MAAEPGTPSAAAPGSITTTWTDETWATLETDVARTARAERLRQHQQQQRMKLASARRDQRRLTSQRYRAPARRFMGARPLYWAFLVLLVTGYQLLFR